MLRHYTCRFLFYILIILSLFPYLYSNNSLVINILYTSSNRYAAVNLTLTHHVSITKTSPQSKRIRDAALSTVIHHYTFAAKSKSITI